MLIRFSGLVEVSGRTLVQARHGQWAWLVAVRSAGRIDVY
jgi:hypothetical protein